MCLEHSDCECFFQLGNSSGINPVFTINYLVRLRAPSEIISPRCQKYMNLGSVHHSIRHLFIIFTNIFKAHELFSQVAPSLFSSSPFVPSGQLFVIPSGETPGVLQIKLSYTCFHTLDWYVFYALAWVISLIDERCIGWL